jgi:thiol:disulfide interchange protein
MTLSTTENIELTKSPNIKKGIKNKTFKMKDKTIARTKKKADKPSADKTSAEVTKTVETVDHATDTDAEKTPEKSDEIEIDESDSEVEEIMEVDSPEENQVYNALAVYTLH